jgi:ribosome-associated protein
MNKIEIESEFIRLDQALKLANLVGGGGEAKMRIQEGEVLVDGEVEVRRGRKLRSGMKFEMEGEVFEICGVGG